MGDTEYQKEIVSLLQGIIERLDIIKDELVKGQSRTVGQIRMLRDGLEQKQVNGAKKNKSVGWGDKTNFEAWDDTNFPKPPYEKPKM